MRRETTSLLVDIREAATYIAEDTAGATYDVFLANRQMRQLVERNFLTIGEAVNRLRHNDPATAARISDVHRIVGFRNFLIHNYEMIDLEMVWATIQTWLPILRAEVDMLLGESTS